MFTKRNPPSFPQREAMSYEILNSLDDCYLLTPRPNEYIDQVWQQNDMEFLNNLYQKLRDDKHSSGYSKSTQKDFLRIFVIHYYASDGFFVFPSYLTFSKDKFVSHVADPAYQNIWDDFEMRCDNYLIKTKWLTHLTFNCVLSDGRIIEYLFNPVNIYNSTANQEMFFTMKKIKESCELQDKLSNNLIVNEENPSKKIAKI
jgi:hypothetical protein